MTTEIEVRKARINWIAIGKPNELRYHHEPYIHIPVEFAGKSNFCELRVLKNEKGEVVSVILNKLDAH